jgi:ABC-type dipeptide/oligopeptide/nickel transport system permease component
MLGYIINRLLVAVPVLILVMVITFTLGYYAPGDPVVLIYNDQIAFMTPEQLVQLRHSLGLDRSYPEQALDYIEKIAHGDLGTSIQTKQPVLDMIENGLPVTLQIALAATVLLVVAGIPLGILAALRHNSWVDYLIVGTILSLRTIPIFVLGPILILIFVLYLGWLDLPLGWDGLFNTKVILPVLLLAAAPMADVVRQTRVSVLEVLSQDYIRTAHAKGLKVHMIVTRHILRNALIPVVTSLGLIVNGLIHGSVFLERLFTLPGFGNLVVTSIQVLDFPVILGTTIFSAIIVVVANLATDFLYPFIDPRVRLG